MKSIMQKTKINFFFLTKKWSKKCASKILKITPNRLRRCGHDNPTWHITNVGPQSHGQNSTTTEMLSAHLHCRKLSIPCESTGKNTEEEEERRELRIRRFLVRSCRYLTDPHPRRNIPPQAPTPHALSVGISLSGDRNLESSGMGVPNEDVVLIESGKKEGDPCVITVNCPDKTGLGCDLCRIILEFGICITKGGSDLRFLFPDSLSHPRDFTIQGHSVIPRNEKGLIDFLPFCCLVPLFRSAAVRGILFPHLVWMRNGSEINYSLFEFIRVTVFSTSTQLTFARQCGKSVARKTFCSFVPIFRISMEKFSYFLAFPTAQKCGIFFFLCGKVF